MKRPAREWYEILLQSRVKPAVAAIWSEAFADVVTSRSFSLGDDELDDFLGQVIHESMGLTRMVENLDYSAERLVQVWPTRFPTVADARPYARNPEALANRVYGGRLGNRAPGDGWKYRGRGPLQITGRDNYIVVGDLVGQDLTVVPELLEQPRYALEACIAWWEDRIPDFIVGDPEKVTRRVNGGIHGLAERQHLTALAGAALKETLA